MLMLSGLLNKFRWGIHVAVIMTATSLLAYIVLTTLGMFCGNLYRSINPTSNESSSDNWQQPWSVAKAAMGNLKASTRFGWEWRSREADAAQQPRRNSSWWEEGWPRENTEELIEWAHSLNKHHQVLNEARYGKLGPVNVVGDGVMGVDAVIVVQVHDRVDYLATLIASLGRVRGIERALLIFSHDLVSEPINRLIRNITYARTIQLLYPYNAQLFPNTFPNITADGMLPVPENADYSIRAADVQIRHHWWWKANYVVDGIVKRYGLTDRYMVCLEDDNVVAVDMLHTLRLMAEQQPTLCPECLMLVLGSGLSEEPLKFESYFNRTDELAIYYWNHNIGLTFSAAMWDTIRGKCSREYCTYDINGWDFAFRLLSFTCLPQHLRVLWLKEAPRATPVHGCGVHHSSSNEECEGHAKKLAKVEGLLNSEEHRSAYFPAKLRLTEVSETLPGLDMPQHGWNDPLDHELCLINTHPLEPLTPPHSQESQLPTPHRAEMIRQLFATKFKLTNTNSSG